MNKIEPLVIQNKTILLDPISLKRLNDFHEYSINEKFYEFLTFEVFKSKKDSIKYLNKLITRSNSDSSQYWFIHLIDINKTVGTIGLLNFNSQKKSIEIGYGISPDYWGKGIFNNAAQLLIDHIKIKLKVHNVYAKTSAINKKSIKALSKLGFKKNKLVKNYYHYSDGHYEDAQIMLLDFDISYESREYYV